MGALHEDISPWCGARGPTRCRRRLGICQSAAVRARRRPCAVPARSRGRPAKLAQAGVDVLFTPSPLHVSARIFAPRSTPERSAQLYEGAIRPDALPRRGYGGVQPAQHRACPTYFISDKRTRSRLRFCVKMVAIWIFPCASRSCRPSAKPMGSRCRAATPTSAGGARSSAIAASRCRLSVWRWRAAASKADALAAGRTTLASARAARLLGRRRCEHVHADRFALAAGAFVIGAARFGTTRLLDNLWIES